MVQEGISRVAFGLYLNACHELTCDITPGKGLRILTKLARRLRLLDSAFEVAKKDPKLQAAIFNIVSGHKTYQSTLKELGGIPFVLRLSLKVLLKRLF